ncbi:aspartyl-phosphate phosphatase Spo0E family protein [Priestia megaterium]|uniref:Aspartyl-phosphate phosphatase Spo0E family protein n=1 Tax=Priestia megaterium TaxID=1404 RepID=A0A6H1P2R9_PRIMG|nr:aspartyl-phosphate phosphatase Spo0E family protein [Priestia megaterium]QIZ07717.1 aspartyl-phosphate phosphatase Spo0E family protein [Priestia megaterium]
MLLFKLVQTEKKIMEYQQAMYDLANVSGLNDPHVLSISQKLDKEILFFQKNSINLTKVPKYKPVVRF